MNVENKEEIRVDGGKWCNIDIQSGKMKVGQRGRRTDKWVDRESE
jgi:hypothetical protein